MDKIWADERAGEIREILEQAGVYETAHARKTWENFARAEVDRLRFNGYHELADSFFEGE